MTVNEYLHRHYSAASAKVYEREIRLYLQANPQAARATYTDILDYLKEQRESQKASSIHRILQGIKKYYNYLIYEEIREDNPSQYIYLKDYKSSLPTVGKRLLNEKELEQLWQHFLVKDYRYNILKNRNISLVGLLLKQALRRKEIQQLNLQDIDLEKAKIFIEASPRTAARTLALETSQILPFYHYIKEDRAKLLQDKPKTNVLFISKLGRAEQGETLHYLIESNRQILPQKTINPKTIRMSVIAEQFNRGHSLQQVQYFAGHRYPSSTERYKTNHLQALQQSVLKHHPLQ